MKSANKSVHIIDPYFDIEGLKVLSKSKSDVNKTICYSSKSNISELDIIKFKEQYGKLTIVKTNIFHDRFIIVDEKLCYSIGASVNSFAKRIFVANKIEDKDIIKTLLNKIKDEQLSSPS